MKIRFATALAATAVLAAACGDAGAAPTTTRPADSPPETAATPTTVAAATGGVTDDTAALTATAAEGWSLTPIGAGVKPVLALDSQDSPGIAFLREDLAEGFVAYAAASEGWAVDEFIEGYFYGPIGLAYDAEDRPNIVYHDHQDNSFNQMLGDLTYAIRDGGSWSTTAAADDGHDGWDSTIAIGDDGVVRAAGIDPQQFGRQDGVEYYELADGVWRVEAIGSGPVDYEWNVSLAVSPNGEIGISYHDINQMDLMYAWNDGSGWSVETVFGNEEQDIGKFSSLAFDAEGRPHISFYVPSGSATGTVGYAVREGDEWTIEDVGELMGVFIDFEGARRITSLALAPDGTPHIAYSDEEELHLAVRADAGWESETVLSRGDNDLGQLVSLRLDSSGTPHISFFEVTGHSPLQGLIGYITK